MTTIRNARYPLVIFASLAAALGLLEAGLFLPSMKAVAPVVAVIAGLCVYYVLYRWAPRLLMWATALGLILIPVYWSPEISGSGVGIAAITPTIALCVPLAVVAILQANSVHLNWLDMLAAGVLGWAAFAAVANYDQPQKGIIAILLTQAAPYVAARCLAFQPELLRAFTSALQVGGVATSVLAIIEHFTNYNIFLNLITPGYLADVWAKMYSRGGEVRAAVSLGQPLVLSIFLAMCFALIVADRRVGAMRLIKWASAALIIGGILSTQGRMGLALAALALVMVIVIRKKSRIFPVAGASMLVVAVILPSDAVSQFVMGSDAVSQDSASYRGTLIDAMFGPAGTLAGIPKGDLLDVNGLIDGFNGSIDNEYLIRLLQDGWIGLLMFVALGLGIVSRTIQTKEDSVALGWAIAATLSVVAYAFVAMLLQQGTFFWMSVAITAATAGRRRTSETSGTPVRLPDGRVISNTLCSTPLPKI